jgi:hypothetical protein
VQHRETIRLVARTMVSRWALLGARSTTAHSPLAVLVTQALEARVARDLPPEKVAQKSS